MELNFGLRDEIPAINGLKSWHRLDIFSLSN